MQNNFQRYEKKYMISRFQYASLRKNFLGQLTEDCFGTYKICNVYYDTSDFRLIENSLEKPIYKEKFRLRSYGLPREDTQVFLEIKKKYDHIVYKRRAAMAFNDAVNWLEAAQKGSALYSEDQILKEIGYMFQLYRLKPEVYLSYDRVALAGVSDPDLRVTFDWNIKARTEHPDLWTGDFGSQLMDPDMLLMEVKVPGAFPIWMSRIFSELEIYPISFSKYGTFYRKFICKQKIQKN